MYYFRASPSAYLAFLRKKPKGVKCFVNELNELYQLSNVCVCGACTANWAPYNCNLLMTEK